MTPTARGLLADSKAKTGEMKRNLFDKITEEKIRSKTTDQAIAKTFRLDRLDQIAEQTKPKFRRRVQFRPEMDRDGGVDYAPEVDAYEDMDVEGLLNLEDYVAPGVAPEAEKQIAKMPSKAPKYEMDPSFWQLDPPPLYEEKDPLAIEGPEEANHDDDDDDGEGEGEGKSEANKILDGLEFPNYVNVEKRLAEPEMTATLKGIIFKKSLKTLIGEEGK